MSKKVKYACPYCYKVYDTLKEARSCLRNIVKELKLERGDFVQCGCTIYEVLDVSGLLSLEESKDWRLLKGFHGRVRFKKFSMSPDVCRDETYVRADPETVEKELKLVRTKVKAGERLLKKIKALEEGDEDD